jgi:hypothetical protein
MQHLYQKDELALPGKLQNREYNFLHYLTTLFRLLSLSLS